MELKMEKVYERDIDLLLINKFMNDLTLPELFLSKIGKHNYIVDSVQHSLSDTDGESDITVILHNGEHKIGLLIEDKINAPAMENQHDRYNIRGDRAKASGKYDEYYVVLVAPKSYLKSNGEAQKYHNKVSYEELEAHLITDNYAAQLLQQAIAQEERGYHPVEDEKMTAFHQELYKYIDTHYPADLQKSIYRYDGPRGSLTNWVNFRAEPLKDAQIVAKADRECVDLQIGHYAERLSEFKAANKDILDSDMKVDTAGKSLVIRLDIPNIDFHQNFQKCRQDVETMLEAVIRLQKIIPFLHLER